MDLFESGKLPQGYMDRIVIKVKDPKKVVELNIVLLDENAQVLFLFKEVSIYNKLSTEKFSNILINSIAHNLYTPLNALIQLNRSLS